MTNQSPLNIGEKIVWHGGSSALGCNVIIKQGIYHGKVCWVGKIKELGSFWIAGVEMEKAVKGGGDGAWQTRHIFTSKAGHGLFLPAEKVIRKSDLISSQTGKVSASTQPSQESCKRGSKFPVNEGTFQATQQNGPVSLKLSLAKGGTNLSKDTQVSGSKINGGVDQRTDDEKLNSNPKKDGKSNPFKRSVFNSLSRKEKESPSPIPQEPTTHTEDQVKNSRGGLLNILKWFSRKQTSKRKNDPAKRLGGKSPGSTTSLVSDSSSLSFFPIRQSVSADNSSAMMRSFNKGSSHTGPSLPQGQNDEEEPCRRNSLVSLRSSSSASSFNSRAKKRMAPQPPVPSKLKTSSSACELNIGGSSGKKHSMKAQSEGPVYGKLKRKAPLPPTSKDRSLASIKSNATTSSFPADNATRPISTFSSFSSVSLSGSSTLKSSTCSENDSLTLRSDSSQKTTPAFPLCNENKGPLSPKPWYKRKKNKSKDKTIKSTKKEKEIVYELWMPDIQYARKNVNVESHKLSEAGNIEAFYDRGPQNGQRFSILSSISDLDRAATEQLEKEKAQRKASKMEFDRSFYNVSSPHMLSQEDLIPTADLPQGAEAVLKEDPNVVSYDNLRYNEKDTSTPTSYSKQSTLKVTDKKHSKVNENFPPSTPEINLLDDPLLTSDIYNHSDSSGKINYEEYIEEIRKELEEESLRSPEIFASKSTPMQKAIFDPELFYQLAKDAKINCESKFSNSPKQGKETNSSKLKEKDGSVSGVGATSFDWTPPSYMRPPQKNFGLRMNNFYTPDVSTILEGSESITSSTTTPADDLIEDAFNRSLLSLDQTNDIMSLNSEYRLNCDSQEITEHFSADLNRSTEDDRNRMRLGASGTSRQTNADKIREEVLFLRERDNFLMWQKTMQETELTRDDDESAIQERKKKWVCDACTLINQPWRLHCEACGSLRPPNPRRVDTDEVLQNSSEVAGSYRTASTDSPMTVIHDDRNVADLNNENNFSERGTTQNSELRNSEVEGASNTNWESELQSYFTIFDDHANAIKRIESGVRNPQPRVENNEYINDTNVYGKINVSKNKQLSSANGQGAKPKERMPNLDEDGNSMNLSEIRRARIRKFQLNYSSSQDQQNFSSNPMPYNEHHERTTGIVREKINMLSELTLNEPKPRSPSPDSRANPATMSESFNFFQNSEERKSQKNESKKSPVLKQSGAVKSVISIFNQLDQLKAVQDKPPPVKLNKRRSIANILNFSHFDRLIAGLGNEGNESPTPAPRTNSPVMADIDISSAISKFDEMAAMAEIESLRKPVPKAQKKKLKPGVATNNQQDAHEATSAPANVVVHNGFIDSSTNAVQTNVPFQPIPEVSKPIQLRNNVNSKRVENRDSCDSIIKDGILYTSGETRRRSMSIGSGTFELINAKDFASIEAHHSRRPSPVDEPDFPSLLELSHPLLMPEIDLPVPSQVTPNERFLLETNHAQEEKSKDTPKNAVERLSQQLTEADGIATFKAMLKEDQPSLGETNTKTLSRLLMRLEDAISNGQHAEASRLSQELAKLRLSCSVYKKSSSKGDTKNNNTSLQNGPVPRLLPGDSSRTNNSTGEVQEATGAISSEIQHPGPSTADNDDYENKGVVRRTIKVDPIRREVKSDTTNQKLLNDSFSPIEDNEPFNVKMYVEDKSSHQGPIPLLLQSSMTVGDLKLKVSEEFGFPVEVQRWILGRILADDDSKSLASHKVTVEGCPIFLYLVAPETAESTPISPILSRSSSFKSNPQNDIDAVGRLKDKQNQEESKDNKKLKQNVKKSKKVNDAGGKVKSSKSAPDGRKIPHQSKNDSDRAKGKDHKLKFTKERANSNETLMQVNGEAKLSQATSHPRTQVTREEGLGPKHSSHLKEERNANVDPASQPQVNSTSAQPVHRINGWVCPQCTLINPKERPGCEACATERPDDDATSSSKKNLRQAMSVLEGQGCVPNLEPFDCMVCFLSFQDEEGVVLRDCLHTFCRDCLTNTVKFSETAQVKCPFSNKNYSCQASLQEREIKDLLSEEDYKRHLDKSVKEAAGSMQNVFYCKTPDCKGFCQFEDNVNVFCCEVCRKSNCLTCQAQHEGVSCKQYQDDLAQKQDEEALKTKKFFDDIIRRGDGIPCPQCSVMLVRKWGCDWMRCPMCRTEICWVTRGPRWGPEGQGDISGGCKCGVNGRKCHPKCTYCH